MDSSSPTTSIDLNVLPENAPSPNDIYLHSPITSTALFDLNNFPEDTPHGNKKKNFTFSQKRVVYEMLLKESQGGKLARGAISKVANSISICTKSVSRIWHDANCSTTTNDAPPDFSSKLVKRVGRKRVEADFERIKDIPLRRQTNIRSLSKALNVPKSMVHRRIKEGYIRPHSNAVKPYLSDENKKARLEFCLSMIDECTLASKPLFLNMHNQFHIDEKWFYMSKTSQKYYLHPDETEPFRTCKSKRFITKLMFLAVVARPRFDATSNEKFDGKIGIWPFVFKEGAKWNSKNRRAGTFETKPILSVTKDVIRSCLIEKVLPSIKEKWLCSSSKTIFIQQDNAKPHLDIDDAEFVEAASKDGFNIRLCCQPANSPDINVLDLGFFRAIDSLQHQEAPASIDEFISVVTKAFDMFPAEDLNNVILTLQSFMVEVMKISGDNNYKVPHMNKQKLIRNGQLPNCIECDSQILNEANAVLHAGQRNSQNEDDGVIWLLLDIPVYLNEVCLSASFMTCLSTQSKTKRISLN